MRNIKGKKYDKDMTTKEIGREVKKYIKNNFKNKVSVRTTYNTISLTTPLRMNTGDSYYLLNFRIVS